MRQKLIEKVFICVCMCVTERETDRQRRYPKVLNHF